MKYLVWDETSDERIEIEADSPQEAAEEFMGDLSPDMYVSDYPGYGQVIVRTYVADENGEYIGDYDIDIGNEPYAEDWKPDPDVGGLEENPGVFGHGGGVVIYEVSESLGLRRITDTWADDGHGGTRESVTYEKIEKE